MAVLLSKRIQEQIAGKNNALWLMTGPETVEETARNGELVAPFTRRTIGIDSCRSVRRVVRDQLVGWPEDFCEMKELYPEFLFPVMFTIKGRFGSLGFLVLYEPDQSEMEMGQFMAEFAGLIITISDLHRKTEEQRIELDQLTETLFEANAHMAAINAAALEMASIDDPVHVFDIVAYSAVTDFGAHGAAGFILSKDSKELVGVSQGGVLKGIAGMKLAFDEEKAVKHCLDSRRLVTHSDYPGELRFGDNLVRDWALVPIKGRTRLVGVLIVESIGPDMSDPISLLVSHAGAVLESLLVLKDWKELNARLAAKAEELTTANEKLEKFSMIDHLTGLYNHRSFQEYFSKQFAQAERYGARLALLVIDVDHFKQVNDLYGHAAGDVVLKEISNRITTTLRKSDICARYGGEEIVVILMELDLHKAGTIAEKLRLRISETPVEVGDNKVPVTVSIGAAAFPGLNVRTREDLFDQADRAMYRAKKAGRNRTVV